MSHPLDNLVRYALGGGLPKLIFLLGLAACSGDDDPTEPPVPVTHETKADFWNLLVADGATDTRLDRTVALKVVKVGMDTREVLAGGQLARVDADTNGEDVISVVSFRETDELTEAAFDAIIADISGNTFSGTTTRYGSQDIQPPDGPTSTWQPDTDQRIPMNIILDENIPPGVYPITIGVYTHSEEAGFERLQIVTPEGRITQDDFLILTPIRIDE